MDRDDVLSLIFLIAIFWDLNSCEVSQ